MKQQMQRGFTLIELVVVIVILGILAATALPKFINMAGDAADAGAQGVAASVASATAINYAKYQISSGAASQINAATTCSAIATALLAGAGVPTGYTITGTASSCGTAGAVDTHCNVYHTDKGTASAVVSVTCTG